MKLAFEEEVDKCSMGLQSIKGQLEAWYSNRYEEKDIVGEIKETYDGLMGRADQEVFAYTGTSKSIRNAIASRSWLNNFFWLYVFPIQNLARPRKVALSWKS